MGKKCKDHLGNEFKSVKAMCEYYDIPRTVFSSRFNTYGWTLEKSLMTKTNDPYTRYCLKKCKDHLGNEFKSVKELCDFYNISRNMFSVRMTRGWSLEDALTKKSDRTVYDHTGRAFKSESSMANFWGIDYKVFYARFHYAVWTLEKSLTTPNSHRQGN